MRTPSPEMRKGPGRGPDAVVETVEISSHFDTADPAQVQELLDAAQECERYLARRQYRLRKLILNCKAYLDNAERLGDALTERRGAA